MSFESDLEAIDRDKTGCFEYTENDMRKMWELKHSKENDQAKERTNHESN